MGVTLDIRERDENGQLHPWDTDSRSGLEHGWRSGTKGEFLCNMVTAGTQEEGAKALLAFNALLTGHSMEL